MDEQQVKTIAETMKLLLESATINIHAITLADLESIADMIRRDYRAADIVDVLCWDINSRHAASANPSL